MSAAPERIVWIASYPKSGNTWVRFMACNLLYGRQDSASALNTLVPDIHEMPGTFSAGSAPAGLFKTHFPFSSNLPHAEHTAGAIYVVRDPADVLASNFFYSRRSEGHSDAPADEFDRYVDAFIDNRGDPRWIERGMGSWEEHVRSWSRTPLGFPVVKVRYEDMIADSMNACAAMAQLLRPGISEAEIWEAVQNSSFQRMRDIERADIRDKRTGIFYKPYLQASIDAGNRFMRRGVVGDGTARLTPDQSQRLRRALGPLLHELGYPSA